MSCELEKTWEKKLMSQINSLSQEQREQIGKQVAEAMTKLNASMETCRKQRPTEEQLSQRMSI